MAQQQQTQTADPDVTTYVSRSARDAAASGYGGPRYWALLDAKAQEYAARFPERADYFLERDLGQALAGNDGI